MTTDASMSERNRQASFEAIDADAVDVDEGRASKELYNQLRKRRNNISGATQVPKPNEAFDSAVREAAKSRSAELRAGVSATQSAHSSERLDSMRNGADVPIWLTTAWILAVLAAIAAVLVLW